jgi:hypothetical protein
MDNVVSGSRRYSDDQSQLQDLSLHWKMDLAEKFEEYSR